MEIFSTEQCMSFRSKHSHERCPNRRKENSEYCGIHLRSKNIRRFKENDSEQVLIKKKKLNENVNLLNLTELCNIYNKLPDIEDDTLKSIEYLCKYFDHKYSRSRIGRTVFQLIEKYNFFNFLQEKHLNKIVKIQAFVKGWLIYKRTKNVNIEDCGTLMPLIQIPHEYYISCFDVVSNLSYGFDIRTLNKLMEKGVNPYNTKSFPSEFVNLYNAKIKRLLKKNISVNFEKEELTDEQLYKQKIVDVFHKYDMLGQYTDIKWFEDLQFPDLIKLYKGAYDLFDYRAQLTPDMKKRIIKSGTAFRRLIHDIDFLGYQHMRFLQNEILNEFERFVTEAEDIENKKLGSNLMLTALVEVNQDAAIALPHLVQSTFDND